MIAHPPCTYLAVSGARWFKDRLDEQEKALKFVQILMNAPIDRIAVENPVSIISRRIRRPDQIIQPWQFGHSERKTTCLWLKNYYEPPGPNRAKNRSRTYEGIAEAMADQWGNLCPL